jgi:hypothetical protein
MANSLHLSREVEVYVEYGENMWKIPVLNGFSFSQSTNISDVTLAEFSNGSGVSRRGRRSFTDSVAPAEFSFSTYARPYTIDNAGTDVHHAVEEVLWAMFAGIPASDYAVNGWTDGLTQITTASGDDIVGAKLDLNNSNKLVFPDATIYFKFGANAGSGTGTDMWYELTKAVLTEASMDFDIDGITTVNWSGQAQSLIEPTSAPTVTGAITTGSTDTGNFIRNRLTQLSVVPNLTGSGEAQEGVFTAAGYSVVLTGGSISLTNEVSFVTPESLGIVNKPLAPVMGARSASGSFTCYLDHNTNSSADLLEDLLNATNIVTNSFKLMFDVGGTGATPGIRIRVPQALIEVPSHSIDDVISVETNFHALPSDIADTDELTITYVGATSQ